MKPVQIEFLMVDHLSARLDKAVGKIERMSQQASSANRQIRELDRSGSLLNNTVVHLQRLYTVGHVRYEIRWRYHLYLRNERNRLGYG